MTKRNRPAHRNKSETNAARAKRVGEREYEAAVEAGLSKKAARKLRKA